MRLNYKVHNNLKWTVYMNIVLPWQPISTRVNYESFSNRYNSIDSLAMFSDGLNFKITSDSFNLRR